MQFSSIKKGEKDGIMVVVMRFDRLIKPYQAISVKSKIIFRVTKNF